MVKGEVTSDVLRIYIMMTRYTAIIDYTNVKINQPSNSLRTNVSTTTCMFLDLSILTVKKTHMFQLVAQPLDPVDINP